MDAVLLGVVRNQGFSACSLMLGETVCSVDLDGTPILMDVAFLNAAAIILSAI
jgi:hypothetical protein